MLSFSHAEEINARWDPGEREEEEIATVLKKRRYRRGAIYFYSLISNLSINSSSLHLMSWVETRSRLKHPWMKPRASLLLGFC